MSASLSDASYPAEHIVPLLSHDLNQPLASEIDNSRRKNRVDNVNPVKGGNETEYTLKDKSLKATLPEPLTPAPQARDIAGAAFGVSGKTVDAAAIVIAKAAPEVIKAVEVIAGHRIRATTGEPLEVNF